MEQAKENIELLQFLADKYRSIGNRKAEANCYRKAAELTKLKEVKGGMV